MEPETAMAIEEARGQMLFSHYIEMVMREYLGLDGDKDE